MMSAEFGVPRIRRIAEAALAEPRQTALVGKKFKMHHMSAGGKSIIEAVNG